MFVETNQLYELLPYYKKKLGNTYEVNEIEQFFFLMAFFLFGLEKVEVRMKKILLSESELLFQKQIVKRLQTGEPIQYILGKTEFYNLIFLVTPCVLIPRPETEDLVSLILQNHDEKTLKLIDIGTGSGCIPLSLKSARPHWNISGIDVSKEALRLAELNAQNLDLKVNWKVVDILSEDTFENEFYDIIVSNPPYVLNSDREDMSINVLNFEPALALFVPDADPLLFYNRIIKVAKQALKKGGELYFEVHELYAFEVSAAMEKNGYGNVEVVTDLHGKNRIVLGKLM